MLSAFILAYVQSKQQLMVSLFPHRILTFVFHLTLRRSSCNSYCNSKYFTWIKSILSWNWMILSSFTNLFPGKSLARSSYELQSLLCFTSGSMLAYQNRLFCFSSSSEIFILLESFSSRSLELKHSALCNTLIFPFSS